MLPFDLFFSPDAHIMQCVEQRGVWERALDQEGQAGTLRVFLVVPHTDLNSTGSMSSADLSGPQPFP